MTQIENCIGEKLNNFINREYHQKWRFLEDIASELGIGRSTLSLFMKRLNIPIRKSSHSLHKINKLPNKEELANEYLNKKTYMRDLENNFGISRKSIWKLLKKYDIPIIRRRRTIRSRILWVDDWEYQVLLGSILGDASIRNCGNSTNSAFFEEIHSISQEKYLLWKREYALSKFNVKVKYEGENNRIRLWTEVSPIFKDLRNKFYPYGKKIVTKSILNKLKPLGLAVWFMDDGTLNLRSGGDISTDGFTKEENEIIRDFLNSKGFFCKVIKRKDYKQWKGTYKIIFNNEGFINFVNVIKQFVHPSMIYKIDLNRQKEYYQLEKLKILKSK